MGSNVWVTFLVLLATLIIGYEIGGTVMSRKIRMLISQMADNLKEQADKMAAKKKEGEAIESGQSAENS